MKPFVDLSPIPLVSALDALRAPHEGQRDDADQFSQGPRPRWWWCPMTAPALGKGADSGSAMAAKTPAEV